MHRGDRVVTSIPVGYAAAAATLLAALFLAVAVRSGHGIAVIAPAALAGACVVAFSYWSLSNGRRANKPRAHGLSKSLLAQITPVACLSAAYPLAGARLAAVRVGSVSEVLLVLAGSLVTPWLSQTVCSPLFKFLSAAPEPGQPESLASRWCALWPPVAAFSTPVAAIFGIGIGMLLGWNRTAICALIMLCALNGLFSQSLVVGILRRNYMAWAAAWAAYAVTLVIVPAWWILPPLAGLATQLVYLASSRPVLVRPIRARGVLAQFVKGTLIGAVLWSDKLFFFLRDPHHFHALLVFLSVLPAIVTYGYYFVRLAPGLDRLVADMRASMENDLLRKSDLRLRELSHQVESLIARVACVGAALCLVSVTAVALTMPAASMMYAAMAVASTVFLLNTVLLYKLEYIGRAKLVFWFAGAHLLVVSLVFLISSPDPLTYLMLAVLSVGILIAMGRTVLSEWRMPEYSLFWRQATQW